LERSANLQFEQATLWRSEEPEEARGFLVELLDRAVIPRLDSHSQNQIEDRRGKMRVMPACAKRHTNKEGVLGL
jgi:hypothetical protein